MQLYNYIFFFFFFLIFTFTLKENSCPPFAHSLFRHDPIAPLVRKGEQMLPRSPLNGVCLKQMLEERRYKKEGTYRAKVMVKIFYKWIPLWRGL